MSICLQCRNLASRAGFCLRALAHAGTSPSIFSPMRPRYDDTQTLVCLDPAKRVIGVKLADAALLPPKDNGKEQKYVQTVPFHLL